MLTNVKLGMILVIRKHVATTYMVLTPVSVVTVGPETAIVAKVNWKLILVAFKINDVFIRGISTEKTTCVIITQYPDSDITCCNMILNLHSPPFVAFCHCTCSISSASGHLSGVKDNFDKILRAQFSYTWIISSGTKLKFELRLI